MHYLTNNTTEHYNVLNTWGPEPIVEFLCQMELTADPSPKFLPLSNQLIGSYNNTSYNLWSLDMTAATSAH